MPTASALLAETANFREELELRPCDAVHPLVELRVVTWYAVAKRPEEPQLRFQAMVDPQGLLQLKNALEPLLGTSKHTPMSEGI
jgi:hypothetical protein